jgi:predicted nucleic acid-binding protein
LIVLDASLMVARILREPHAGLDQDLFTLLDNSQIIVPSHWPTEIANALRTNIRRGRIDRWDMQAIVSLLSNFELTVSPPHQISEIGTLALFAVTQQLTAYDAAYVNIALAHRARLATLDTAMRAAAQRLDIPLLPA